jgi:hypothetical protein
MLPFIVIVAAILFFLLKRSGIFDELGTRDADGVSRRRKWGRRLIEEIEEDPELNQRLEVFKDFLENQQDEDA